ncbi:hypothetical protein ACLOJK_027395 [Asimina triloba]
MAAGDESSGEAIRNDDHHDEIPDPAQLARFRRTSSRSPSSTSTATEDGPASSNQRSEQLCPDPALLPHLQSTSITIPSTIDSRSTGVCMPAATITRRQRSSRRPVRHHEPHPSTHLHLATVPQQARFRPPQQPPSSPPSASSSPKPIFTIIQWPAIGFFLNCEKHFPFSHFRSSATIRSSIMISNTSRWPHTHHGCHLSISPS